MVLVGTAEFEVLQPTYFPANTQALAIWRASICKQKLHSMCCTQPVFLQACRWYLFGVQVCEQKHGLVRSPNTRKNKRPKQPCNHIYIHTYIQLYTHYLSPNILKLLPDLPTSSRSSSSRRGACATLQTARAKSKLTRAKSCAYQPFGLPLGVELSLMICDMPRKNGSFNRENFDHHQIWR